MPKFYEEKKDGGKTTSVKLKEILDAKERGETGKMNKIKNDNNIADAMGGFEEGVGFDQFL
jgi:hypothetical protein